MQLVFNEFNLFFNLHLHLTVLLLVSFLVQSCFFSFDYEVHDFLVALPQDLLVFLGSLFVFLLLSQGGFVELLYFV